MSTLDDALTAGLHELFHRFESALPPNAGAVLICYTRGGTAIEISGLVTNDAVAHYLRVLDAAKLFASEKSRVGAPRVYRAPPSVLETYKNIDRDLQISMLVAFDLAGGAHEVVRIWNRGNRCGELVVRRGDAEHIAASFGLVPDATELVPDDLKPLDTLPESDASPLEAYVDAAIGVGVRDLAPYRELATGLRGVFGDERNLTPHVRETLQRNPNGPHSAAVAIDALCDEIERLRPLRDALGRSAQRNEMLRTDLQIVSRQHAELAQLAKNLEARLTELNATVPT